MNNKQNNKWNNYKWEMQYIGIHYKEKDVF